MQIRHLPLVFAGAIAPAVSNAAVLLYEPFSYGSTGASDITTLSGSATGLDGTSYTNHGAVTTAYLTDGLSMGNLAVSGGRVSVPYNSNATGISRGLSFGLGAGSTLYGSYLFQQPGGDLSTSVGAVLFGSSGASDSNADVNATAHVYGSPNLAGIRTAAGGVAATGTEYGEGSTNTVMMLFQVTNMNATSGTQDLSLWVLTAAQFATFKAGGINAAELNAAATGTGATNVLQRASYNNTGAYAALYDTDVMRLFDFRFNASYDEVRLSDASLDEVTPVPEPASLAAFGLATLALGRRRR